MIDGLMIHLQVCLNTVQINALLALDTRRALDRAAKSVKALDGHCIFNSIV